MIMRAMGGNCRHIVATANQQDLVIADMAGQHAAIGKIG